MFLGDRWVPAGGSDGDGSDSGFCWGQMLGIHLAIGSMYGIHLTDFYGKGR